MVAESKVKYEEDQAVEVPVSVGGKPNQQNLRDSVNELLQQERFWAAAAHAMGPMIILMVFFTDFPALLLLAVTAGIYLYHRDKSTLVSYHARQALAAQLMGTVGWFVLIFVGAIAWAALLAVSIILIVLLVGIILTPLVAIAGPILLLASFLLPLGMGAMGALGAWEAWHGRDFRYPYLADWLDKRLGAGKAKRGIVTV